VRTAQILEFDSTLLISVGWICNLVNLLLTFLPLILAHKDYINNKEWNKYFNATALCPGIFLYLAAVHMSVRSASVGKKHCTRVFFQLCFPLVAEVAAFFSLPFICLLCEQVYENTLLV
jgi:uncharacterized membrane protein